MKQAGTKVVVFLRRCQSLIAWGICFCLVAMTFFQKHLSGDLWIIALMFGMFANFAVIGKYGERYPLPERFKAFVILALVLSGLFAFFNFWVYIFAHSDGQPRMVDGRYVLDYKGTIAAYLTEQEYHRLKCAEQRFWAGHLSFFYAMAMYGHLKSGPKLKVWTPDRIKKGDL